MIDLSCDYNIGCAPELLAALTAANEVQHNTYGSDAFSARAKRGRPLVKPVIVSPER